MNAENVFNIVVNEYLSAARELSHARSSIYGRDEQGNETFSESARDLFLKACSIQVNKREKLYAATRGLGDQKDKALEELLDCYKRNIEKAEKLYKDSVRTQDLHLQNSTYSDLENAIREYRAIREVVESFKR